MQLVYDVCATGEKVEYEEYGTICYEVVNSSLHVKFEPSSRLAHNIVQAMILPIWQTDSNPADAELIAQNYFKKEFGCDEGECEHWEFVVDDVISAYQVVLTSITIQQE